MDLGELSNLAEIWGFKELIAYGSDLQLNNNGWYKANED